MVDICSYAQLAEAVRAAPGAVRLIGIDGCGGAGKTTFAARLARHGGGWPIVHTDDFASHDEPLEWWPRFLADVIEPLRRQEAVTFRPYDWARRCRRDPVTVAAADVVVVEGVSATRAAWRDSLAMSVWVETDSDLRLRRGLARDGEHLAEFWRDWRFAEDGYVADEQPATHADLVVAGDPVGVAHDPESEFVLLSARRRGAALTQPR